MDVPARGRLPRSAVVGAGGQRWGQRRDLSDWRGSPVDAVAGVAKPQAFFAMLQAQGLQLAHTQALPDHDDFSQWQASGSGRPLLCTEKDAVKLWVHQPQAWAVPLQLQVPEAFWQALDAALPPR